MSSWLSSRIIKRAGPQQMLEALNRNQPHQSNRARRGLFAGKDIRSGNQVSHSEQKTRRFWKPNVQKKRVFSEALNDWVSFQFSTTALKAVDHHGGIDNYLLNLDDETIAGSNYVVKYRELVASILFHQGSLDSKYIRKFGYHRFPPPLVFPKKLTTDELEQL